MKKKHLILILIGILVAGIIALLILAFFTAPGKIPLPGISTPPRFAFHITGGGKTPLKSPLGVAVHNGKIYVADTGNARIQIFNQNGKFITSFGKTGLKKGELAYPAGIAVSKDGKIYVADARTNRISVFTEEGKFISVFPRRKAPKAWGPTALHFDKKGNLYVTDVINQKVFVFDSKGNRKLEFGKEGRGNGEFSFANGITTDDEGNIYVADSNNQRIQVFNKKGKFLYSFRGEKSKLGPITLPRGIAFDAHNRLLVVDVFLHTVIVFDKKGKYIRNLGKRGVDRGEFNFPNGIAVDRNRIYVTDRENNRISVWTYS